MTGTYLLFQSDVSLYGAFLDGLDNKKNNCSSLHSKFWLTSIIQMFAMRQYQFDLKRTLNQNRNDQSSLLKRQTRDTSHLGLGTT